MKIDKKKLPQRSILRSVYAHLVDLKSNKQNVTGELIEKIIAKERFNNFVCEIEMRLLGRQDS